MLEALPILGGAVLALATGIAYFARTPRQGPIWQRVLASAYGPAIALVFFFVVFLWPETYRFRPEGVRAFFLLHLLPLGLFLYSLRRYPGPRRLHFYLAPVTVTAWFWTLALGYIFVHGL